MKVKVKRLSRTVDELSDLGRFTELQDPDNRLIRQPSVIGTYQSNPYLRLGSQVAQILGVVDDTIIGGVGTMPMRIVADGVGYGVSANPDLLVNEKYRSTGFALELLESEPETAYNGIAVNFYVSRSARRVTALLGASVFGIAQFAIVRRSAHFFAHRLPRGISKLICFVLDVAFAIHRAMLRVVVKARTFGWKCEEVSSENELEDFVSLVAEDSHRFREDVSVVFMKWVMENDFDGVKLAEKRILRVVDKKGLVGFVMTRVSNMGKRVRVVEWQSAEGREGDLPWLLLMAASKAMKGKDAAVISISKSDVNVIKILARLLPRMPEQAATVHVRDGSPLEKHDGWRDQSNWRIRPIMGDCAFY